jgi:hypothetical protein
LKRLIDDVPIDEISEEINELSNNGNNDEDTLIKDKAEVANESPRTTIPRRSNGNSAGTNEDEADCVDEETAAKLSNNGVGYDIEEMTSLSTAATIRRVVNAADTLDETQKREIGKILMKYERFFSPIPGECKSFEYEFVLRDHQPVVMKERPILFVL